jgi:hypothetical protein
MYSIQPYAIEFVMTGGRSEVYSVQPYVIVFDDWRQVRGVLNTTLCDPPVITNSIT